MLKIDKSVPCYKCEGRHSNCHVHCEKYLEFSETRREISRQRQQDMALSDLKSESIKRMKTRRR